MTEKTPTDKQTPEKTKKTPTSQTKRRTGKAPQDGETSAQNQEGMLAESASVSADQPISAEAVQAVPKKRTPRKKPAQSAESALQAEMPARDLPSDVLAAIQSLTSAIQKDAPEQPSISARPNTLHTAQRTTPVENHPPVLPQAENAALAKKPLHTEEKPTPKRISRKKAVSAKQESLLTSETLPAIPETPILPALTHENEISPVQQAFVQPAIPLGSQLQDNPQAPVSASSFPATSTTHFTPSTGTAHKAPIAAKRQEKFSHSKGQDEQKEQDLPSYTPVQPEDDSLLSILPSQDESAYPRAKRRRSRRKKTREDGYEIRSNGFNPNYNGNGGNGGRNGNVAQRNSVPSGLTPLDFPQSGPSPFGPKEIHKVRGENQADFPALLTQLPEGEFDLTLDSLHELGEELPQPPLPEYLEDEHSILGAVLHHVEEEKTPVVDDAIGNRAEKPRSQKADVDGNRLPPKPENQARPKKPLATTKVETPKAEAEKPANAAKRVMYVSVAPSEQVEVVITENGLITEYFLEMAHQAKIRGNIYKGVISNIDTNLQAAFVNFGAAKNGFLQIDEVHPEYWQSPHDSSKGYKLPLIQKVLKVGQEVLVQVVKEPAGTKGAFLTTWVTLAGRFLVLTPGQETIGVSRKVEDESERSRLKELLSGIDPGEDMGVIIRTASEGASKTTIQKDLQYLKRLWKDLRKRVGTEKAPCLIYEESDLSSRAVRDYLVEEMDEIWVDNEETSVAVTEMAALLYPRKNGMVKLHQDPRLTLWERFNLQRQLSEITSREVTLPSGGRLVFDQTEALMAIDINSGKVQGKSNFESMVLRTNMEAAEAIARHLRLRDVGGQVVIDFIEMRDKSNIREVEKCMRNAMKNDRARHDVSHISPFGLMELVRQRTGTSAISISSEPCPHCGGTGVRRNLEWQALQALRTLQGQLHNANKTNTFIFPAEAELALYLLNKKKDRLLDLETRFGVKIEISLK